MGSVTDKQLTAVAMRDQEYSTSDIANILGLSRSAASSLLRRAYRAMEREFVRALND
jgi:DNA-directed RNA polymerase specialized sigma24 family protein